MDSSAQSIPQPRPDEPRDPAPLDRGSIDPTILDPDAAVCFFRHIALLHLPEACRGPVRHLGDLLFDWSMETFGIAGEQPDSEAIAVRRLEALGDDLRAVAHQLAALSLEPGASEADPREIEMGRQAGHLAPAVLHLARRVREAAEGAPR